MAKAAELIATQGADALSLRSLARSAGVSHGAPAHHFRDRRGLFTALAADGFERLATALEPSVTAGEFDQTAVAYVRFAVTHAGHFEVMFRPALLDPDDAELRSARRRTSDLLGAGLDAVLDEQLVIDRADARNAAWSMVHGLATLWLNGELDGGDIQQATLNAARQLFGLRP